MKHLTLPASRNIILSIFLLAALAVTVARIVFATAPNPGHNFTEVSGGVVQGDLLYGSAADTLAALAKNASSTRYLSNTGSSNNPAWAQVDLTNGVTGNLPLGNGGAGASLTASNGGIVYSGAASLAILAGTATASKVLLSGASGAPTWSTPTYPNTGTLAKVVEGDGTNYVETDRGTGVVSITAASAAINTTETVITKTAALAANRLQAGTIIRITLHGTTTASAANASTFSVRIGTNGTTSDGLMQQAVTANSATSGTTIPFEVTFVVTVRTTGASATSDGYIKLVNQGTTGISTTATQIVRGTATNVNTTTANNIISVTYKSAASTTTTTFQDAFIELVYK